MGKLKLGTSELTQAHSCVLREGFQRAMLYTPVIHEGSHDQASYRAIHELFSRALSEGWAPTAFNNSSGISKIACNSCAACYPTRVDLNSYKAGNKLIAVTEQNPSTVNISLHIGTEIDPVEHFDLYERYIDARSKTVKGLALDILDPTALKMHAGNVNCIVELRDDDGSNTLQAACWATAYCRMDGQGSMHAHYNLARHYYNPNVPNEQMLGLHLINQTLSILDLHAKSIGAANAHAYMGSWMATKGPFSYKEFFKPDIYIDGAWQNWREAQAVARHRAANNSAKFEAF